MSGIVSGVGKALSTIMGGGDVGSLPTPPTPEKPTVMPLADGDEAKKAKRRSIMMQSARKGRASTILSQGLGGESDTLG